MYLKLNRNARLFLKSPATGTVSLDGDHRTAESLVGDHRTSAFALGDNTPQNDAPRAATLSQLSAAAIAGVGAAIDRRAYVTRARDARNLARREVGVFNLRVRRGFDGRW